jgi:L-ascorbate metabolism protein UlaG (beta-lactamase superfamily)
LSESTLRITYFGHATILIEIDEMCVLTDPVLRRRVVHLRRLVEEPAPKAIDRLDGILISHLHFDHFDPGTLKRFDRRVTMMVPQGGAVRFLERSGFRNVRAAAPGTILNLGTVKVRAVHAQHSGSRGTPGMSGPALGYLLEGSHIVYFAGDTDIFPEMAELGGLDVALLPVAGWGPRLPEGDHMNPRRAAEALRMLKPRVAIPIHWGTYTPLWVRGGYSANQAAGREFQRHAAAMAPEVIVQVLAPGDTVSVSAAPDNSVVQAFSDTATLGGRPGHAEQRE